MLKKYLELLERPISIIDTQQELPIDADFSMKYDVEEYEESEEDLDERKKSPFYTVFKGIYDSCMKKLSQHDIDDMRQKKPLTGSTYYSEPLINYLLIYILSYFLLWSAVILSQLDVLRDGNATVENYFEQLYFERNYVF